MTPEQAVDIIRNPDEYCVASRQEARLLLANEYIRLKEALLKIADWHGAWGPWPETNEAWCSMAVVTAREATKELKESGNAR